MSDFVPLVVQLPILVALIAGLVALGVSGRRLPRYSRRLARAGLVVLLIASAGTLAWGMCLHVISSSASMLDLFLPRIVVIDASIRFLLAVTGAIGLWLLVTALVTGRADAPESVSGGGDVTGGDR